MTLHSSEKFLTWLAVKFLLFVVPVKILVTLYYFKVSAINM